MPAPAMTVLADLVLIQHANNLPVFASLCVTDGPKQIDLTFTSRASLDAWHAHFGGGQLDEIRMESGLLVTNMHRAQLHGWSVCLNARVADGLPVEALTVVAQAADAAVIVAETLAEPVTRVRQRSLSEMIDAANNEAEKFNAEFPPGTPVEYWSGVREGDGKIGHTKGKAFASRSGQAVVFLDNASSYHALSHVRPLNGHGDGDHSGCDKNVCAARVDDALYPLVEVVSQPTAEDSAKDPDTICGHLYVSNVGSFKCRRFNHTDARHWDSVAEVGWADPKAGA